MTVSSTVYKMAFAVVLATVVLLATCQKYDDTTLNDTANFCQGKPDGNYPMTYPQCQDGYYISCSNSRTFIMPCALGWYTDNKGQQYTARMIYDAASDSCQLAVSSCSPTEKPDTDTPQCQGKIDILFVLDASKRVSRSDYQLILDFAAKVSSIFTVDSNDTLFGAIMISSSPYTLFGFSEYENNNDVRKALLAAPQEFGDTNIAEALEFAREYSFTSENDARPGVGKVAIVITSGISVNATETATSAELLKKSGVTVLAVGIGPDIEKTEIPAIASSSNLVFDLKQITKPDAIKNAILKSTCQNRA